MRKMQFLALAGRWGGRGASGLAFSAAETREERRGEHGTLPKLAPTP